MQGLHKKSHEALIPPPPRPPLSSPPRASIGHLPVGRVGGCGVVAVAVTVTVAAHGRRGRWLWKNRADAPTRRRARSLQAVHRSAVAIAAPTLLSYRRLSPVRPAGAVRAVCAAPRQLSGRAQSGGPGPERVAEVVCLVAWVRAVRWELGRRDCRRSLGDRGGARGGGGGGGGGGGQRRTERSTLKHCPPPLQPPPHYY